MCSLVCFDFLPSLFLAPMWQASPVNVDLVNFDFLSFQDQRAGIVAAFEKGQIGIGGMDLLWNSSLIMDPQFANRNSSLAPVVPREEDSLASSAPWNDTSRRLQSSLFFPVFNVHSVQTRTPVAVLHAIIDWTAFLKIPPLPDGFLVVLKNSQCGINNSSDRNQSFTFQSQWGALQMLGPGDQHDGSFDKYEVRYLERKRFAPFHGRIRIQGVWLTLMINTKIYYLGARLQFLLMFLRSALLSWVH